jgi:uncharacterized protein
MSVALQPTVGPRPFHLLAKPTGAVCNLDCSYCYFLSKERLYPGSRFRMADELLELYVRQLIEAHGPQPEVTVAWQGGEPTIMGVDFFRRAVELAGLYARPGQRIVYTMQTNGTLLDDEWGSFLHEHGFLVGISIDGTRDLHNAYRVDKGGKGSFDRVIAGLDVLKRHEVDWNVLTTVHAGNEAHGREIYCYFRDELEARYMQFIPIVERDNDTGFQEGETVTDRSVSPDGYGRFLVDVFEEWVRHDVGTVYVQMFDVALANWVGEPPGLCVHSETCGSALALEHTGDLYSCDHFVEPRHKLGNIRFTHMLDLVASERQGEFGRAKRDSLPRFCRECNVRFACHGGCPKDRIHTDPYGEPGLNYLCAGFLRFFRHVDFPMRTMSGLLARGQAPAQIMRLYAAEDARRGRNEPCTCGSGRKWKHCHGASPAVLSPG